jgi:hypothetical protein
MWNLQTLNAFAKESWLVDHRVLALRKLEAVEIAP